MLELNVGIGISGAGKSTFFSSFDNYKIMKRLIDNNIKKGT